MHKYAYSGWRDKLIFDVEPDQTMSHLQRSKNYRHLVADGQEEILSTRLTGGVFFTKFISVTLSLSEIFECVYKTTALKHDPSSKY
jgi:hypothetical protein